LKANVFVAASTSHDGSCRDVFAIVSDDDRATPGFGEGQETARQSGAGGRLFEHVRSLGEQRGCGRMDWTVLDWNTLARDFYNRRHAEWMKEWLLYRITY
jgi:hypothetical protein